MLRDISEMDLFWRKWLTMHNVDSLKGKNHLHLNRIKAWLYRMSDHKGTQNALIPTSPQFCRRRNWGPEWEFSYGRTHSWLAAATSQHSFYYILQSPEKFANLKKYSQPKRWVMFYSVGILVLQAQETATHISLKELLLGGKVGNQVYIEVLQQRVGTKNIKRLS